MKIKVAIYDSDRNYLEKMRSAFAGRYAGELEFYLFTTKYAALEALSESQIDVFLINKSLDVSPEEIPGNCTYAYLADLRDGDSWNDRPVIFKFQRMDAIYRGIKSVYDDRRTDIGGSNGAGTAGKVILFSAAAGGVGTSSMAAACAVRIAKKNQRVIYVNLQKFGGANLYFSGEGYWDMTDLIEALQNSETDLSEALQNWAREDARGVRFYSQADSPLDMMKLTNEDILRLVTELRSSGAYERIVLDVDFSLDEGMLPVYRAADKIVMVSDGTEEAAAKTDRALEALRDMEGGALLSRICRIFNRVEPGAEVDSGNSDTDVLGAANSLNGEITSLGGRNREIVGLLASMSMFDRII